MRGMGSGLDFGGCGGVSFELLHLVFCCGEKE